MSGRCDQCGNIGDMWYNECVHPDFLLYKEAAEKWAECAAFKTETTFVRDSGFVEIGVMCSQCGAKLACKHAADCKAARILGLKREGEG